MPDRLTPIWFEEGFFAHGQAMPRCICSYPPDSYERADWRKGWDAAEQRLERQVGLIPLKLISIY